MSTIALVCATALTLSGCVFIPALLYTPGPAPAPQPVPSPSDETQPDFDPTEGVLAELHEYYTQEVDWEDCGAGQRCAAVTVPMDWFDPDPSKTLEVHMVVQEAENGEAIGDLLYNPGGPGASGFDYVQQFGSYLVPKEILAEYNLVGFDPRGVARSSPITCYEDPETLFEWMFLMEDDYTGPSDSDERLSDESLDASRASAKEFADACAEHTGEAVGYYGTEQVASDMDLMRALLGNEKLDYYGVSYGTLIGATYAGLFPERVGRFVLDAAVAPDASDADGSMFQAKGFELALGNFLEVCISESDCPIDADSRQEALDAMTALFDELDEDPLPGAMGRLLDGSTFFISIAANLYSEFQWPTLVDVIEDVQNGETLSAFTAVDQYYGVNPDRTFVDNSFEALVGVNCLDYAPEDDYDAIRAHAEEVMREAPTVGRYFVGLSSCIDWPNAGSRSQEPITAPGADPIIVIGGINDPATPYEQSVTLADQLESGILITVDAEGHGQYGNGNSCVDVPVTEYLLTGNAPAGDIDDC